MLSVHKGKKPFKCDICDVCFTHKHDLKYHTEYVHEGNTPFKCDMCDAGIGNYSPVKFTVLALLKNQVIL